MAGVPNRLKHVQSDSQLHTIETQTASLKVTISSNVIHDDFPTTAEHVMRDEATFIQDVSQFYNQETLSDILLKVGQTTYFGHKFVLAKSSDVFRTMLYENNWTKAVETTAARHRAEIELEETEECQAVFDKFLRYLYTAELSISCASAVGTLCLADKYNVASLKELCLKYMTENSRSPRLANALRWYPWAKLLGMPALLRHCAKTIAWNYGAVIASADWPNTDIEFICDFLQSSELIVPNEFAIWTAVSAWLVHESHRCDLASNIARLLPLIRFPQMIVSQLYQLERSELATDPECSTALQQLLSRAYRFRALCPSQAQLAASFGEAFYQPRDYTDLVVDTVRIQNTLRFGIQVDVKTTRGPVPSEVRDADWKVTYRKQGDVWLMLFYCHDSALINNEAHIQPSIVALNEQDQVVQVHREERHVCSRGNMVTVTMTMEQPDQARSMGILIKPIPT